MSRTLSKFALSALLAATTAGTLATAACSQAPGPGGSDWWGRGPMGAGHMGPGGMMGSGGWNWQQMGPGQRQRAVRHWTYMNEGVPKPYRGAQNPLRATAGTVEAGGALYRDNCASCHGARGLGDGEAGRSLEPSPAILTYFVQTPMAADEYLLWTISEGGADFGTDMPAFRDALSRTEIWQIVTYMRAGFPPTP